MALDVFSQLTTWYAAHCNGDWEHQYGVRIETIDNPGWKLSINLSETELADLPFDDQEIERTDTDWIHCRVLDGTFDGHCGPKNLNELVAVFLAWSGSVR